MEVDVPMRDLGKKNVNSPKTALGAASRMQRERGYVVIGIVPSNTSEYITGRKLDDFAGEWLEGYILRVAGPTNRADWAKQFAKLFGKTALDPNTPQAGERFFRCQLVKL